MEQSSIIGHFGPYGGRFVPEALIAALEELDEAHQAAALDPNFQNELAQPIVTGKQIGRAHV